jgi:hypothetical protein
MGELRCVDGSVLTVVPVACRDRTGTPYEITLDLRRGRKPFASVGERCGFRLSQLAASVTAAREDPGQATAWPDPDDRFPEPGRPPGDGAGEAFRPGEREYFSLRSRERSDPPGSGEFRCVLRDSAQWLDGHGAGGPGGPAGWRLTRRAVIEAWGADGIGVRAVLTSAELMTFLDTVLTEPAGAKGSSPPGLAGRVPDESARSRLPALRA